MRHDMGAVARSILLGALLLAGCRHADETASTPSAPAAQPPSTAPATTPRAAPPAPAATTAEVWLESVGYYDGAAVWFPDELAAVDDAIAEVLARDPHYRVIDNRALRTLRENAQRGRIPGSTT